MANVMIDNDDSIYDDFFIDRTPEFDEARRHKQAAINHHAKQDDAFQTEKKRLNSAKKLFEEKCNEALDANNTLLIAITSKWGSLESFKDAFLVLALTRGIGWAMLSYDVHTNELIMHWIDEQHLGQLQGTTPIIALDMWEHSYVADYQPSGKKQYATDFLAQMNWAAAEANYVNAQ